MRFNIYLLANHSDDVLFITTSKRGFYDRISLCVELRKLFLGEKYPYLTQFRRTLEKLEREERECDNEERHN